MKVPYHYAATLQYLVSGFGCGWVMPIIALFNNSEGDFSLTDEDCSWIASLHYIGRMAGTLLASAIMNKIGRVAIIMMVSFIEVLVWVGVVVIRVVLWHYAIRFAFGIAIGLMDTVIPVYIAETSSPNVRAVFGTTISLFFFGGEIMALSLATYKSYLLVAIVAAGLSVANLSLIWLLRQPAQHLLMKGHEKKAKIRFQWMRGDSQDVDQEFDEMKDRLCNDKPQFSLKLFLDPRIRIVCWIHALSFLTGFPPINAFLTVILEPASTFSRDQLIILFAVAQLAGAACAAAFIERFGRRTLWMVGSILSIVAHSTTATLRFCLTSGVRVPGLAWLLFAAVATYGATYASLILTLTNTTRGELLPAKFKAAGVCAAIIANSMTAFGTTYAFNVAAASFGVESAFLFFSLGSLLLLVYVYFCLPETKGLTLVEIQKLFEK